MYIVDRTLQLVRGFLLSYGPTSVKKIFWDKEFSGGKWNFIDDTAGDCVYAHLERHAGGSGDILDLGCGPGNTANELSASAYRTYVGMDISEEALVKARRRTEANGRTGKNRFEQGDFISYKPPQQFDVILFRESMYHVPINRVKPTLDRFTPFLKDGGVFVVRMFAGDRKTGLAKPRPMAMFEVMEKEFDVVEKATYPEGLATVLVFRPKSVGASVRAPQKVAQ
jgi:SAM-dependent methyltransferase